MALCTLFLGLTCGDYDGSISVENTSDDTLVFIYKDQKRNDYSFSEILAIDKNYMLKIDTLTESEFVLYPKEQHAIIHHGKWKHYPINDSLYLTFYFFKFDTIKKYNLSDVVNNYKVHKRLQFATQDILNNNGIIEIE